MTTAATPEMIRLAIGEFVSERNGGGNIPVLVDDVNLMGSGILDSFGMLELIGWIEERFGAELDLEDVEPGELTTVGPFCRLVAAELARVDGNLSTPTEPALRSEATITAPTPLERPPARSFARTGAIARAMHTLYARATGKAFSLLIAPSFESFGSETVLQPPIRLAGQDHIAVGSGVFVGRGSWLQTIDPGTGKRGRIVIGDRTSMAGNCTLSSASSIVVGRAVSFARGVYVADHAHEYRDTTRPVVDQGITDVRPIEIGDGAWLGQNAVVLPGVRIGRGAVVSANSVVSSDVPDHSVVAGMPARAIRRLGAEAAD